MASIRLHTAYRRLTKAGTAFADAGETLVIGEEISKEDAAKLLKRGGAVDPDAPVEPVAEAEPDKGKSGK